jgi:hypothetical protein
MIYQSAVQETGAKSISYSLQIIAPRCRIRLTHRYNVFDLVLKARLSEMSGWREVPYLKCVHLKKAIGEGPSTKNTIF